MTPSSAPTETSPLAQAGSLDEPPPIWFVTTDGFYSLPLADTAEERAERAQKFVRTLYSRGDDSIWEPAAEYYAAMAETMAGSGASYAALGLFSTAEEDGALEGATAEDGHQPSLGVAQCAFTLAVVPREKHANDPRQVAERIEETFSRDQNNYARLVDLPCGPAVTRVTQTEYQLDPEITATGEATKLLTGQIQAHIPFPAGPFTAVFTLDTASMDYWDEFCGVMVAILETVSFEEPEIEFVDEDEPSGAEGNAIRETTQR